jgi:hypothetical protein
MLPCKQQPAFHTALMSRKKNLTVVGLLFVELKKTAQEENRKQNLTNFKNPSVICLVKLTHTTK